MRPRRQFRPAPDALPIRLLPYAGLWPASAPAIVVRAAPAMDSTGEPTTEPGGGIGNPIVVAPPTPGGDGGLC